MKLSLILGLVLITFYGFGQQQIAVSKSASGIDKITMDFKYPELITLSAWDKNEVSISGKAKINNGENDEAFKLNVEDVDGQLKISSLIENIESLPKRIVIRRGGIDYFFPTDNIDDPEVRQFLANGDHQYQTYGVIKEITLDIKVPRNIAIELNAKYGLVEVIDLDNPLVVDAKYGGADVSFSPNSPRNIKAKTKFGEMFSDLDMTINTDKSDHGQYFKWTTISAQLAGGGTSCILESKYGNLYLRKNK